MGQPWYAQRKTREGLQPHPHSQLTNLTVETVCVGICLTTVGSLFRGNNVRLLGVALTAGPALLLAALHFIAATVVSPASAFLKKKKTRQGMNGDIWNAIEPPMPDLGQLINIPSFVASYW